MVVEFGLNIPIEPIAEPVDGLPDRVEAILSYRPGLFKSLWVTDHFFWGETPTHECWTLLTYAAARFPSMKVGTMVIGQNYRNPALLAKMASTLQILSGGRLILGLGAGWKEDEYRGYGYVFPPPAVRVEQLEDTLEIIQRLWTQTGKVSYQGKHYHIDEAMLAPKPDPLPPIVIGGGGVKTMRLAARFAQMWNIPDAPFTHYAERAAILRQHCVDIGRNPNAIRLSWFGRFAVGATMDEALRRGGGRWTPENAFVGTPEQIRAQMQPYLDLGVSYFMIEILDALSPGVLDIAVDQVIDRL